MSRLMHRSKQPHHSITLSARICDVLASGDTMN
jgi:hypothetical protein